MSLVKGENVLLYIFDGGLWKLLTCGRSCTLTTSADSIETSITGSGSWRTYEYVALNWTASLEGLIYLEGVNTLSLPDIRSFQYGFVKVLLRYQRTDEDGNVYTDEGLAIITSVSDTGEFQGMATFNMELKGTGPLTGVFVPTPVNPNAKVKRFEYEGVSGETSFSNAQLIGKEILDVVVDGIGRSKIITSGTPVDQEAKFSSGSGTIELPIPLDAGTQVYILFQDI
jgi:predicted secreted protein